MLSDATLDAANRAIRNVFETTSVAWRTIPHWLTGDPGRTAIRNDSWFTFNEKDGAKGKLGDGPYGGPADQIWPNTAKIVVTLAAASSPTPDQIVSAASAKAVELVREFDNTIACELIKPALKFGQPGQSYNQDVATTVFGEDGHAKVPVPELLKARETLDRAGYVGSCAVWAGSAYFQAFHGVYHTRPILPACASVLNMGVLLQWFPTNPDEITPVDHGEKIVDSAIIIGRRQEIAPFRAFEAAPGPEPIDIAVSVPPSLEVVGDTQDGNIELQLRIQYALRFKDNRAVVAWTNKATVEEEKVEEEVGEADAVADEPS